MAGERSDDPEANEGPVKVPVRRQNTATWTLTWIVLVDIGCGSGGD